MLISNVNFGESSGWWHFKFQDEVRLHSLNFALFHTTYSFKNKKNISISAKNDSTVLFCLYQKTQSITSDLPDVTLHYAQTTKN